LSKITPNGVDRPEIECRYTTIPAEVLNAVANNRMLPSPRNDHREAEAPLIDPDISLARAVAVGHGPIADIAVDGDGTAVVVTNYAAGSVTVLNPTTLAVEGHVAVTGEPFAAAATEDRAYVAGASASYDAVSVIDTNTKAVIAEYPLAFTVPALTVSPDGKRVFAARVGRGAVDVAVIDTTAERVGTIDIATGPGIGVDAVRVDSTGRRLYVATTDAHGGRLVVVDTETARLVRTVAIGSPIRDFVLGSDKTGYLLTTGAVQVVDLTAGKVTSGVEIGGAPTQMVLGADGTRAYVVDGDQVAVLCTLTSQVVDRLDVGAQPSGVAVSRDGSRVYISDYAGGVTMFAVAITTPMLYAPAPELMAISLAVREPVTV